jgi:hypothetical protein
VITRPDRQGNRMERLEPRMIQPLAPRLKAQVAFLVNSMAVSYPENYLMPVEHLHLAEIVGTPTAGTTWKRPVDNPYQISPESFTVIEIKSQ